MLPQNRAQSTSRARVTRIQLSRFVSAPHPGEVTNCDLKAQADGCVSCASSLPPGPLGELNTESAMPSKHPELHVPSSVGRAALDELDRIPWAELEHAYGTGKVGPDLHEDVAETLRRLGEADPAAFDEGVYAFFSNLCHQGTIYRATAFAVPFLAALAADRNLTPSRVSAFVAILASIGIAASFDAPHGSHAGSWGPGPLTRNALRASRPLLETAARCNPGLDSVAAALAELVRNDTPNPVAIETLERLLDEPDEPAKEGLH